MPVALERALKRKVAGKKMSKERKDAYVYGTLRKTGWKPERERKKELSAALDSIIQFAQDPLFYRTLKTTGWKPTQDLSSTEDSRFHKVRYEAAKARLDKIKSHVGPFQTLAGNPTRSAVRGRISRVVGSRTATLGAGLGVGWWLGKKHEENKRNSEYQSTDKPIEFQQGGYTVRKVADYVGPSGRITGNEYKSEKAPGFGAAVNRNVGKIAFPALGAITGAALGHAGWGRARPPATRLKLSGLFEEGEGLTIPSIQDAGRSASLMPAKLGAGIGALAFLPAGTQADRVRKHQSVLNQVIPMATEDYMKERGIHKRPVQMSAKERLIQFKLKLDFGARSPLIGGINPKFSSTIRPGHIAPLIKTNLKDTMAYSQKTRAQIQNVYNLPGRRGPLENPDWKKSYYKSSGFSGAGGILGYSDASKPIQFDASILGPWSGPTGHTSKIDQYDFPAGLSPAAALQFPLPVLMRYLNQRNILQQQFSWKQERLIRLSAKLDEIAFARGDRALQAGLGEIGTEFPRYGAHQSGLALRLRQRRVSERNVPFEHYASTHTIQAVKDIASGKRPRPASHVKAAKEWLAEMGL